MSPTDSAQKYVYLSQKQVYTFSKYHNNNTSVGAVIDPLDRDSIEVTQKSCRWLILERLSFVLDEPSDVTVIGAGIGAEMSSVKRDDSNTTFWRASVRSVIGWFAQADLVGIALPIVPSKLRHIWGAILFDEIHTVEAYTTTVQLF